MSLPGWSNVSLSSENSFAVSYLNRPNGRIISAFFLGCVFMNGLQHMSSSLFFRGVLARLHRCFQSFYLYFLSQWGAFELPTLCSEKAALHEEETASIHNYSDHMALVFTLNLCLSLAGLAYFISLLAFQNQSAWKTGCVFVVAWGGMASQVAILLGLMILIIELSQIGVKRWEPLALYGFALVGLAFVFATNATNSGTTKVAQSVGIVFCYKKRFLPTTLTSSIIRFVIETYLIVRLVILSRSRRRWLSDHPVKAVTIVRACSLLLLDLLTVVPDSIVTNVVAKFLPFCIGAVTVFAAFNWKWTTLHPSSKSNMQSSAFATKHSAHSVTSTSHTTFSLASREHMFDADELEQANSPLDMENVIIITTGATTQQHSVKPIMLPVPLHPRSAPPQFHEFSVFPGKILRSQAEVAAQLEMEAASTSQTQPEAMSGPAVPRPEGEQNTATVLYDDDDVLYEIDRASLSSLVYGSDILQVTPSKRRADGAVHVSPAPTQTSFALSPRSSRRTTYRFSHSPSIMTTKSSAGSFAEWDDGMPRSARKSIRRQALLLSALDSSTPSSSTSRHFWRRRSSTRVRTFSASVAAGTADTELTPVYESSPAPGAQWFPSPDVGNGNNAARKSRRGAFGRSARFSRRTTASSSSRIRSSTSEPAPSLPTAVLHPVPPTVPPVALPSHPPSILSSTRRRALPTPWMSVPKAQVSPASSATLPLFTSVSAPAAPAQPQTATGSTFELPASAGMVEGPHPPPSALLSGTALQEYRDTNTRNEISRHRRSDSSSSAYSQESCVSLEIVRRPSMQW
ncbi:uncharacterized protein PHACADRAFT_206274 [Phanerochaete carnosa HHB-10118-sp]|uniref:Uncharacterized protein n=1 Tax=Phanerochaete carnosa (strain HHB-10118-sp) TaxID=650164 RepID=K5VB09_PHACS|nr:uncharacterized protein PHACADRAFT_206274 [Phanerochaete carnosa HHB-10118-sp]EKM60066.1 hypothetical protein PHACADRAFT_206274 [Phanerochaete carnosa HHB-10118-sp]